MIVHLRPPNDPPVVSVGDFAKQPYSACECCSTQLNTDEACDLCVKKGLHRCGATTRAGTPCRAWTTNPTCRNHDGLPRNLPWSRQKGVRDGG